MLQKRDAVSVAGARIRRRRRARAVQQHAVAVLRAAEVRRPGQAERHRVPVDRGRQPLPVGHRRKRGRHRLLSGNRGRGRRADPPGGVRVPGLRVPEDGRGHRGQLEVRGDDGRLRAVHRVPRRHADRVRHAVQPAQRPRLLRHELRGVPARVVRVPPGRPVDVRRRELRPVPAVRYVPAFVSWSKNKNFIVGQCLYRKI